MSDIPQTSWELRIPGAAEPLAIYRESPATTAAMIADGICESLAEPFETIALYDSQGNAREIFQRGVHFTRASGIPTAAAARAKQLAAQMELKTADELTGK